MSRVMKRALNAYAGNPAITSIFTADPSAHVWADGRLYIYASRDMDPARGCDLMDHYHVFSTTDMASWRDEGEIFSSDDVPWGRPEGGFMWAPDCAYRDGTYYFYYPHPSDSNWNDSWKIGVAVSENPTEGFVDQGYIEGLGGFGMIDPCVFVDEDKQAYMYYGGAAMAYGGRLSADMMHLDGEMQPMEGLHDFHEASWVIKKDGLYYLMYSDNTQPCNNMRYAVSKTPLGPWTHKGVMLLPVGCETTHGSIAAYKGHWYLFYHNSAISGAGNLRSVCVDELFWDENGNIRVVEQTKDGIRKIDDSQKDEFGMAFAPVSTENGETRFSVLCEAQGRYSMRIHYKPGAALSKTRVFVNQNDLSLINLLPGKAFGDFTIRLCAGQNEICLKTEVGEAKIDFMDLMQL